VSERLKESMSAVIDGEADEFELRRVLDEVSHNPELLQTWERYHAIGAHLSGQQTAQALLPVGSMRPMADAVWGTLGAEAAQADDPDGEWPVAAQSLVAPGPTLVAASEQQAAPSKGGLSALTGLAVAASVALMVTVGFFVFEQQQAEPQIAQQTLNIEGPVFQVTTQASPSDLQRANAYMLHHVQQTALNKAGVASFVKVVTFEKPE
jgi:sigma-E factor negative regulatory protein RseA